jgi:hypothetical protein
MKVADFETSNYKLIVAPNTGGCFFLERVADGHSTNLFTGSEGYEDYQQFRRAYNISGASFDILCSEYIFESEEA